MSDRDVRWADLLRRANDGDSAAYAAFLNEATPVIRRIVSVRGVPGEMEDIVQEVLLALHAKRHTWRPEAPVAPWLYAIARYKATDGWRRRRATAVPIDDLADVLAAEPAPDATAGRDLGRLLAGLDARSAGIVRSVAVDGESAVEVGARLGMQEGAVRVALHRAMARLRAMAGGGG